MGIRDKPTAPASPWQNGLAVRLIGSIRRECVDHIIVLGEVHLRRVLKSYADYYNSVRTHRSLNKDAPVTRQIQRLGSIKSHAILGGLHHHYARALSFRYTQPLLARKADVRKKLHVCEVRRYPALTYFRQLCASLNPSTSRAFRFDSGAS
jgi:Integrase core domain